MNRSFVSGRSSKTEVVVDRFAGKTVEDMDRLIDAAFRKSNIEHKKFDKLRNKSGKRPSVAAKGDMQEMKKEIRKLDADLAEYREVKENKIPYWDKLKDHCSQSPFYRFTINKMLHNGIDHAVSIKMDEENVIQEGYKDRHWFKRHR